MKILYDGWPLVAAPESPAALHLLALLSVLPLDVQAEVALPEEAGFTLPGSASKRLLKRELAGWGRLRWLQSDLPAAARASQADLLHLTTAGGPLTGKVPVVISPTGSTSQGGKGFVGRLLISLEAGGMAAARHILWPEDLEPPTNLKAPQLVRLPPLVHPAFDNPMFSGEGVPLALPRLNLPESFVLYHHTGETGSLNTLLTAWSWTAPVVAGNTSLAALGLDPTSAQSLRQAARQLGLDSSLQVLPKIAALDIPFIYKACSAVIHLGQPPVWGDGLRRSLAAGKPIAAEENPRASQIVGPAAYLVPEGDGRALGAALITLLVEDSVAAPLVEAGWQRAANWQPKSFAARLVEAYLKS